MAKRRPLQDECVMPAKAGIVRLRACMDSEVRVLVRHALSGL
jgi:hypothetical protein